MKRIETKVLFRCSGLGEIMTNAQGKSNYEKYQDAVEKTLKLKDKLDLLVVKKKEAFDLVESLDNGKEDVIPTRKGSKSPKEKYQDAVARLEKINVEFAETVDKFDEAVKKQAEAEKTKYDIKLSSSCRKYLKTMAIEIRYKRKKRMTNKYIKKGIAVEDASIELYSEFKGFHLDNNTKRVSNEFLTGETDLEFPDVNGKVTKVTDIKSSYDIDSFEDNRDEDAKKNNFLQLQGYCILHDCEESSVANVLTNNDWALINDEITSAHYKENTSKIDGFELPLSRVLEIVKDNIFDLDSYIEFLESTPFVNSSDLTALIVKQCDDLEAQKMFDSFVEVDLDDRVIEIEVPRCEETEKQIIERIEVCRKYLADVYNIHHVA